MPTYKIRITEATKADMFDIIDYISKENVSAALKLANEIEQKISALADFPDMGANPRNRRLKSKGYKMLIIDDYLVFYVMIEEIVEIRRIISAKRNYIKLL